MGHCNNDDVSARIDCLLCNADYALKVRDLEAATGFINDLSYEIPGAQFAKRLLFIKGKIAYHCGNHDLAHNHFQNAIIVKDSTVIYQFDIMLYALKCLTAKNEKVNNRSDFARKIPIPNKSLVKKIEVQVVKSRLGNKLHNYVCLSY
jgi:hypothetical protein